jgi:hypothetical protein
MNEEHVMSSSNHPLRTWSRRLLGASIAAFLLGPHISAQTQPPVQPIQGNVAVEGQMKKFYQAANTVIVVTIDGVEHVYHFTKDLVVHGGKGTGADALAGLQEGTTVVVHYTAAGQEASATEIDRVGGEGLRITEGMVTYVDRRRKQITIRFGNGKTETFRLTDRAAAEMGPELDQAQVAGAKIVVYYTDEGGQSVAHFFKRVS